MAASRLPIRIARRLDRLAARAHRFHRFAHHPLCAAYAGETLHVGRRAQVCRGCAAAGVGGVLGVGLGLALPVPPGAVMVLGLLVLGAIAFAAVRRRGPLTPALSPVGGEGGRDRGIRPSLQPSPRFAGRGGLNLPSPLRGEGQGEGTVPPRASKLLTRTLPAAAAAGLAVLGARAASIAGLATAVGALALLAGGVLAYRRRGPDRSPCAACPERGGPGVCSGFAPMARREKAFSRLAGRLLRAAPPPRR